MAYLLENLIVHLRGLIKRMGARDGGEIFVSQFQLDGSRKEATFTQTPRHHFAQAHERGLQALGISGIFIESMFMADGFRIVVLAHRIVKPSSCVFTARLPC